ncbi:ER sterol deacetylase Say1 [Schizosaccharomyces pombe]|uniref:Putative steryl acetyl hydrolase mug81 n=1 Tax=Schizosaccharomyces pombe (strain 972 / ATCC 24843) TaxID=284812 RepID=MU180_SCHPO|nr:putative esterase/lipase [Schizosaccharomyces pombe]Q9HDV1.1 RecName: Full=Putative steryl acetyl hydrolase mug81; AltName: Full=Meiotically up-regulated gene 180 protein [Schizosaccharomyces pombe 972h-]CAC21404.1 esterase/lipase (predicted) [Schizosaccharomyces pombe]|eukprot:NP_596850.1 putative esterase/lipase [Schizosaccharomyces pombe]
MISLSLLYRILTLPIILVGTTILYFTIGTNFPHDELRHNLLSTLFCSSMLHLSKGLTVKDVRIFFHDSIGSTLLKNRKKLNSENELPNYGEKFTHKYDNQDMPDSVWLAKVNGMTKSDPIILHLHGGMMALPYDKVILVGLSNLYKLFSTTMNRPPSILLVDYSLVSQGYTYPKQVRECLNVYQVLISKGFRNITVLGESAGGTLILSFLYQISELSKLNKVVWPKGVALISPWLDLTNAKKIGSYRANDGLDVICYETLNRFGKAYVNNEESLFTSSVVNINMNCDISIWSKIPPIQDGKVLVLFGENEVFRDEILSWTSKIGLLKAYPNRVLMDKQGIHIGLFLEESPSIGPGMTNLDIWKKKFSVNSLYTFLRETFEE